VLFDGVCNLCNGAVRFIAANDPQGRFTFASLQSPQGRAVFADPPAEVAEPETIVLVENGRRYARSDAVLHIALGLRAPWPLAFAAILIPRRVRDGVYSWIARNRYRWFGRTDVCAIPTPAPPAPPPA
jgi:predicted DCC family thiol-disulfide oxidoreductase YuxK